MLGVCLGLLGSIAINTGNNLQSLGLKNRKNESKIDSKDESALSCDSCNQKPLYSIKNRIKIHPTDSTGTDEKIIDACSESPIESNDRPWSSATWIVGTGIFFSGSLINFVSYAFAAQSMLASLESIQFVTNLLFGKFMLGARVTKTMSIGTVLTVTGTVLAVQFSSKKTLELKTDEMKELYSNPAYIIYLALMVAFLVSLLCVNHIYEKRALSGTPLKYTATVIPLIYSISSAIFGTQSVVQAKVLAELLSIQSSSEYEENIFASWFTYATLIYWLLTVAVWLTRLNNALSKFNPIFIIPFLQCSFIFFAIVSGGIFFREFDALSTREWIGFWSGILVMFSGLVLLTPKQHTEEGEEISQDVAKLLEASCEEQRILECNDEVQQVLSPTVSTPQSTKSRPPRNSLPHAAISTLVDAVCESAKGVPNMLLQSHNGTQAMTQAMVAATEHQEKKKIKSRKLKKLKALLIQKNCSRRDSIMSCDVLELANDLGLIVETNLFKETEPPKTNELDILRDELGSPRAFRVTMLKKASELETSLVEEDLPSSSLEPYLLSQEPDSQV